MRRLAYLLGQDLCETAAAGDGDPHYGKLVGAVLHGGDGRLGPGADSDDWFGFGWQ
jgi:hypothetical protein